MIWFLLVFSTVLELMFSTIIPLNTCLFTPLFSVSILVLVYLYCPFKRKHSFFCYCFFYGLFYDVVLTNTIFLNAFLFLLMGYLIVLLNKWLSCNFMNLILFTILVLIGYRISNYLLLLFIGYHHFSASFFWKGVYSSLLLNVTYVSIIYGITERIRKKHHLDRRF